MKTLLTIAGVILLVIVTVVLYVMSSTGYFRKIEAFSEARIIETIELTGAEDMAVSRTDSFMIISATDRNYSHPTTGFRNGLYLIDLKEIPWRPQLLSAAFPGSFSPHGISMIREGNSYQVMAINHTEEGHSIEVFSFDGVQLTYEQTLRDSAMISPNDLVLVAPDVFYFSNDHGNTSGFMRLLEDYGGLPFGNVVFYDGSTFKESAEEISYANGVGYDASRKLLYVASPRHFLIRVFRETAPGELEFVEDIPCGTGVDNIELDEAGQLYTAGHPNLLKFRSYAGGKSDFAPSEILKIDYREPGEYDVEPLYLEDGTLLAGSSVALRFGHYLFAGTVMDREVLVMELGE